MKRVFPVRGLVIAIMTISILTQCSGKKEEQKKDKEQYQAGDRKGIDTSIVDISASEDITQLLCQRWDNKEDDESIRESGGGGSLELPMRGFYIFENGSVIKDPRDKMLTGKWSFDNATKLIRISFDNGKTETYKIMALSFDELILKSTAEGSKNVYYKADGLVNRNRAEDPFYPPNMQWRIPAKASESDEALRKRMKDHLHFYYLLYTDNHHRNSADISFYGLPGCLKWYAGGIHLKQEEDLDQSWKSIFYNAKDAGRGYAIMDKLLSKKYKWGDKDENWLVLNAGVLQQMEKRIDSL